MSADFMGCEILKLGIEPLVHFTCKDKNRNQIESQLYALDQGRGQKPAGYERRLSCVGLSGKTCARL